MANTATDTPPDSGGCCSHNKATGKANDDSGSGGGCCTTRENKDLQDENNKGTKLLTPTSLSATAKKSSSCCGGGEHKCSSTTGHTSASTSCCSKSKPAPADIVVKKSCCGKGTNLKSACGKGGGSCCDNENNISENESCAAKKSCCASKAIPAVKKSCCDGDGEQNHGANSDNSPKQNSNDAKCCGDKGCCDDTLTNVQASSHPKSDCCSGKSNHNNNNNSSLKCLAVIRPGETAVDVFDTTGKSKTFRISNHKGKQDILSGKKLCFSTHGASEDIGEMLTPCFEKGSGKHAEKEDGCRCGIEEQHLHAHVYDPEVCGVDDDDDANNNCSNSISSSAARRKATDWRFLSQLTLHLDDDKGVEDISYMPITASMPKVCNSNALQSQLTNKGLKLSHWIRWRNGGTSTSCGDSSYCGVKCKRHRLYPVQHEDHTDYLIHNETTGDLHMEHPNCASCGDVDIHGRFKLVHTRSWMADKSSRINLHVYEVHEEPFHLLDFLSGLFEFESSRVHAARAVVVEDLSSKVGRSQFSVKGICCASEVPQVEAILRPLHGVSKISVNPTTKMVYVDHDFDIISADDIAHSLDNEGFESTVIKNAATADQMAGIPSDVFVKSTFDLTDALHASGDADRGRTRKVIQACLDHKCKEKQVENISLGLQDNILALEHNPYYLTAASIVDILARQLQGVKVVSDGGADGMWALPSIKGNVEEYIEQQSSTVRWPVVLSGVFWIISMLSFIGGNWEYLKYVALLSVAFGLPSIAVKAFRTLRRLHFDVNCMMLFAALGALPLQEYTESAAVTFLFAISETLEQRATARARGALSAIVRLRPEYANVINPITKDIVVFPANCVAVGTSVSVRPGDKIPCDGIVIEGKSTVDEASLTGESRPVTKSAGMRVSGGTINNGNTQLVIKTTATSNNSAVSRLIRLIEEAQTNRSETEKIVDSFAKIYTPIVVLLAFSMCTIPWAFGTETGIFWARNGLITMVIACPCSLIISTPVTYVAGLAATAQRGVIVKGGQYLEELGRVKSIYFDKTGTLTQGIFAMLHFNVIGETRSRNEVLGYLALMEAPASHPLSSAIVKGAANEGVDIPKLRLENHTLLPGEGITAIVAGKQVVHVGNKKLFQRLGLYDNLPEEVKAMTEGWAQASGTVGFISIEGEGILGAYCVADKIRDEAKDVVGTLNSMGIGITMLTGDQRQAALKIGGLVGLTEHDIVSELLPEDKLAHISDKVNETKATKKCWKPKRAVMMVGDGVNDAPALALADVSVAMGEGAALAMETADVTLMDSNLEKLLYTVLMGRRVIRTILENIVFSFVVKAIVMGFAFSGRATLWAAIASDVGAMLLVTLNGMKLLPSSRKVREMNVGETSPV